MKTIENVIKFTSPGNQNLWEQYSLPIGNGYMGASFFGGIARERVVLNEKTLWTGGPSPLRPDYNGGNRTGVYKTVKKVQELLAEGNNKEAEALLPELTCSTQGWGFGAYQLLCDAIIEFPNIDETKISDYSRSMNLDKSLYSCSFTYNGAVHKREAFASYPDRVICMRFGSNAKGRVCLKLSLDKLQEGGEISVKGNTLEYYGALADNSLRYNAGFTLVNNGGEIITSDKAIMAEHCNDVTIYFTAATDYSDEYPEYRTGADPKETVSVILADCTKKDFDALYKRHYEDYSALFGRAALSLNGECGEVPPIEELMAEYKKGGSVKALSMLEPLYFQFGRYMLISSSREGSLPANLQGVWNESNMPPWCCDYHINVNLQMNYWGAYNSNLAETAEPLVRFLDKMRPAGRVTAKEYYGIVSDEQNPENGWIAHTQSTPFGWTSPGWEFYWGWSTAAVAWLMQNIWEYYEFTLDEAFLREQIYPIMRETAKFYSQWLIYDEKQDRLVSSPTYSPEHGPVTVGNTYEQCLIDQFYADFIRASEILGEDKELREKIAEQKKQLKPYYIGARGQLKEWYEEDTEGFDTSKIQPFHRHVSHLLGLYPGKSINSGTKELIEAAKVTLNERGDDSTGWARAYKLNLWARLKDGNRAYKILRGLLDSCTFPNLFDFHPPFQLDGNFGGSAGITEMLLQSHEGYIEPLAAVPELWESGEYRGLCARGGFEVSAKWSKGRVEKIEIVSKQGGTCRVKTDLTAVTCGGKEVSCTKDGETVSFETEKGGVYCFGN
ncbi:MAG: glycosyl hydrolase family 95 catalytic domain-containing protein [Ruminiclostridium sp.]